MTRIPLSLLGALFLMFVSNLGCKSSDLDVCDQALAEQIVFDPSGNPAYAGQAQVELACSGCHGQSVTGPGRRGAPEGLDFDMVGSRTDDPNAPDANQLSRIATGHRTVVDVQNDMWSTVDGETMPPGEVGAGALMNVEYAYADNRDLERLDTPEGLEVYRNWLACGAPVIERTGAMTSVCGETSSTGDCAVRGMERPPVAANWNAIFDEIIEPGCGTMGCHLDANASNGMLALSDRTAALAAMVDQASMLCGTEGNLIAAGMADQSYLVDKLSASPACGLRMPVGGELNERRQLAPIREWINAGANP